MKLRKNICYVMTFIIMMTAMFANIDFVSRAAAGDLGEGYNVANFSKDFASVDEELINTSAQGRIKVLVFARTNGNCPNSNAVVSGLCESNWVNDDRVSIAVIDIDKVSKDIVTKMRDSNPESNVTFCYCENNAANNAMWDYLAMTVGDSGSVTLPVTVIIDSNNMIQYCLTGYQASETIYSYVKDLAGEDFADNSNSNEFSLFLEGTFDEKQAFEVLELVNEARSGQGLPALKMDEKLMDAAMQRAAECAVYYDHTRPNGENCFTILEDSYKMASAENIAIGYDSSSNVMKGWLNSKGHYKNIMGSNYTNIGIGCFYQNGAICWVQLFSSYGAKEATETENYVATAQVKATSEYVGAISFRYSDRVEVGKRLMPTKLYGENLGFPYEVFELAPKTFSYKSEAPEVATVDSDGTLQALTVGDTIITASIGDKISVMTYVGVVEKGASEGQDEENSGGDEEGNNGDSENENNGGDDAENNDEVPRNPNYVPPVASYLTAGDADFNGVVELLDAQLALKFALRIYVPYELEVYVTDVDFDNEVTLKDAQEILISALKISIIRR